MDTSKLKKVVVIVTQPRGVPAGSVTIVAYSAAEKACSRKGGMPGGHVNSGTERSSSSRSRKEQQQQQRREKEQQRQPLERSPRPSAAEKACSRKGEKPGKWLKLQRKWRARRLCALARIFFGGVLRRWLRTSREQRAASWQRTLSEERAALWLARSGRSALARRPY